MRFWLAGRQFDWYAVDARSNEPAQRSNELLRHGYDQIGLAQIGLAQQVTDRGEAAIRGSQTVRVFVQAGALTRQTRHSPENVFFCACTCTAVLDGLGGNGAEPRLKRPGL